MTPRTLAPRPLEWKARRLLSKVPRGLDGDARESLRGGQGREGGCEGQGRDGGRATPNENLEVENLEVENLETTFWVQCDRCSKWRRLLNGSSSLHSSLHSNSLDGEWTCANSVLPAYSCEDDESECH